MVDVFSETTQEGFGKRVKGALAGAVVGFGMLIAAFPVLWTNEGRAARQRDSLDEGAAAVVEATPQKVDAAQDGKLVHLSGNVAAPAPLTDEAFGITADSLALERKVEMYQWREKRESRERRTAGGGRKRVTEYKYSLGWNDEQVDSSRFHREEGHENPGPLPLESRKVVAETAQLGAFTLDAGIARRFDDWQRFEVPAGAASTAEGLRPVATGFYRGSDPGSPRLGDVRVTFRHVPEDTYSFVARQAGTGLASYATRAGNAILLVEHGTQDAKGMFATAQAHNNFITWLFRGIGFVGMWAGLALVFRPIAALGHVMPLVGTILEKGLGFVAFVIAACLSLLTIAFAWLAARPLLGIALLAAVVALVYWLRKRGPTAPPSAMPPPPPPAAAIPPPPPAS